MASRHVGTPSFPSPPCCAIPACAAAATTDLCIFVFRVPHDDLHANSRTCLAWKSLPGNKIRHWYTCPQTRSESGCSPADSPRQLSTAGQPLSLFLYRFTKDFLCSFFYTDIQRQSSWMAQGLSCSGRAGNPASCLTSHHPAAPPCVALPRPAHGILFF